MFFLPLDMLTVIMVVLFVANFVQYLWRHFELGAPNELVLVAISTSVGYALYDTFHRHFNESYGHFENLTVSVFGPQYWIIFFVIAIGAGATAIALRRV